MRIGLLSIDHIDEPHRSLGGDYADRYDALFRAGGVDLVHHDGRAESLPDASNCDGWIIPGSRESVYDDIDWIRRLEAWIVGAFEAEATLLGVCFGHQLIAQALGGRVERAEIGWNMGVIDYEIVAQPAWLDPLPERFGLLASHQDQVIELPPGSELLASAATCPLAAYTIDDRVLCVQGHPEFDPIVCESIYRSRVERIGAEPVAQALTTLDRPIHRATVVGWMVDTVRHRMTTER